MVIFSVIAALFAAITWWRPIVGVVLALYADSVASVILGSFLQMNIEAQKDSHFTLLISFPVLLTLCLKTIQMYALNRRRPIIGPLNTIDIGLLGLGFVTILGCLYTPQLHYGLEIAARFWVFALSYYFFARVSVACPTQVPECQNDFMTWVWIIALIACIAALIEPGSRTDLLRMTLTNVNPINFSMLAGAGLLVTIYCIIEQTSQAWWRKWIYICGGPVFLYCVVSATERGPIISLVCATLLLMGSLLVIAKRTRAFVTTILLIAVVATTVALLQQYYPETFGAFMGRFDARDSTVGHRLLLYAQAFDLFSQSPFLGAGTAYMEMVNGKGFYAHNMVLEVASEHGVLGLIMVVFLFGGVIHLTTLSVKLKSSAGCFFAAFLIHTLVEGEFSGHFTAWKAAYFGAGMVSLCVARAMYGE